MRCDTVFCRTLRTHARLVVSQRVLQRRASHIVCSFNPTEDDLRIYWRDIVAEPIESFRLSPRTSKSGKSRERTRTDARQHRHAHRRAGVFFIGEGEAGAIPATRTRRSSR
jgi:uncharacterized protein YigE (DUF2233 family)